MKILTPCQPWRPEPVKRRCILKRLHWTTTSPLTSAVHGAWWVATEHQKEIVMNVLINRSIVLLVVYDPSPARDWLQPRQSIFYLQIHTVYLLQNGEENWCQCSSQTGGTITASMWSAYLRDSCGGGIGQWLAVGEVTWQGHKIY